MTYTPPVAKITPLSFSPTEMAYFQSEEQIRDMILSTFDVPPAAVVQWAPDIDILKSSLENFWKTFDDYFKEQNQGGHAELLGKAPITGRTTQEIGRRSTMLMLLTLAWEGSSGSRRDS